MNRLFYKHLRRPIYLLLFVYAACWLLGIVATAIESQQHADAVREIVAQIESQASALHTPALSVAINAREKVGMSNHDLRCAENYFVPSFIFANAAMRFGIWPFMIVSWQLWKAVLIAGRSIGLDVKAHATSPSMDAIAWGFRGIFR